MHTAETESAHQRFVREARALLKPSPVRLHHVPRWLVQRIRARLGKPAVRCPDAQDYLEHAIKAAESDRFANWLDHWGSTVYGERPAADQATCCSCGEPMQGPLRYCDTCRQRTADAIRQAEAQRALAKQAAPSNDH